MRIIGRYGVFVAAAALPVMFWGATIGDWKMWVYLLVMSIGIESHRVYSN